MTNRGGVLRWLPMAAIVMLLAFLCLAPQASAQQPGTPQKSPLGVAPPSPSERGLTAGRPPLAQAPAPAAQPSGPLEAAWMWVERKRAELNRTMASAVRALRTEPLGGALLWLVSICFAYGVLHAAGPGHGKGVISAYALANGETVRRGILLSFMAALFQAFSAIAIFVVLSLMLGARKADFDRVEGWLETASWALVAGLGAWLLYTRVVPLLGLRAAHAHGHVHTHDHSHHHDAHRHAHAHDHGHGGHAHHGHHHHAHDHGADCADCGHMHMPTPQQVQGTWSWRKAFGIAAAVGIRPCTGALILLAFCMANGLLWAGVLGTLAMSLGTAITISALAALAVGSRDWATWLAGADSPWGARVATSVGILGSALVMLMGAAFLVMSLKGPAPF